MFCPSQVETLHQAGTYVGDDGLASVRSELDRMSSPAGHQGAGGDTLSLRTPPPKAGASLNKFAHAIREILTILRTVDPNALRRPWVERDAHCGDGMTAPTSATTVNVPTLHSMNAASPHHGLRLRQSGDADGKSMLPSKAEQVNMVEQHRQLQRQVADGQRHLLDQMDRMHQDHLAEMRERERGHAEHVYRQEQAMQKAIQQGIGQGLRQALEGHSAQNYSGIARSMDHRRNGCNNDGASDMGRQADALESRLEASHGELIERMRQGERGTISHVELPAVQLPIARLPAAARLPAPSARKLGRVPGTAADTPSHMTTCDGRYAPSHRYCSSACDGRGNATPRARAASPRSKCGVYEEGLLDPPRRTRAPECKRDTTYRY